MRSRKQGAGRPITHHCDEKHEGLLGLATRSRGWKKRPQIETLAALAMGLVRGCRNGKDAPVAATMALL